ncbi:hypothetical protein [Acidiphilium sp. C61]|uniref:hypothetical protein n=1 Tax=Acidiphilium sp. C61 TaxID=1671485 RepID=UPI00157B6BE7|nr:hypothetical protein [Acidiphilium sp. C61]
MNIENLLKAIKPNIIKNHDLKNKVIISLTSYPSRFQTVYFTIISLLNQSIKPDKIILWVFKNEYNLLPRKIIELINSNFEVKKLNEDWKSYNKLIPSLIEFPNEYLVTADDDVLYKPTWIEELILSFKNINGIVAHRAHIIQYDFNEKIEEYNKWIVDTPEENFCQIKSPLVFPTGVGGVLYPPDSFDDRILDIYLAMELCPTADDIWFWFMHTLKGNCASSIGDRYFIDINPDQSKSLFNINVRGKNDDQIRNMVNKFGIPETVEFFINNFCKTIRENESFTQLKSGRAIILQDDDIGLFVKNNRIFHNEKIISFIKRNLTPKKILDLSGDIGYFSVGLCGIEDYKVWTVDFKNKNFLKFQNNLIANNINFKSIEIDIEYFMNFNNEKLNEYIKEIEYFDLTIINILNFDQKIDIIGNFIFNSKSILIEKNYGVSIDDYMYNYGYRLMYSDVVEGSYLYKKNF